MKAHAQARLLGAIRLAPDVDTIGIPVFKSSNWMFVPEMDPEFRIARFLEFVNEEGYEISYDLPDGYRDREFSVGSPTPLPFWFRERTPYIIDGDAEADDIARRFGRSATSSPVLADIAGLLHDARTGVFRRHQERWVATDIASGFSDIFYEPPVHSKYWIKRFNLAVSHARKIVRPPHRIDIELRRIALEWVKRFSSKTDYPHMIALLGDPTNGIITERRAKDVLFAFLVDRVSRKLFGQIEKYLEHPTLLKYFPYGIDYYYARRGWPKVPFRYEHPRDLRELLTEEYVTAGRTRQYDRAEKLTFLMFGRTEVPFNLENVVYRMMGDEMDEFSMMRREADKEIFPSRDRWEEWQATASALLVQHERLMRLFGIINGQDRLSDVIVEGRFNVDRYYLRELEARVRDKE